MPCSFLSETKGTEVNGEARPTGSLSTVPGRLHNRKDSKLAQLEDPLCNQGHASGSTWRSQNSRGKREAVLEALGEPKAVRPSSAEDGGKAVDGKALDSLDTFLCNAFWLSLAA